MAIKISKNAYRERMDVASSKSGDPTWEPGIYKNVTVKSLEIVKPENGKEYMALTLSRPNSGDCMLRLNLPKEGQETVAEILFDQLLNLAACLAPLPAKERKFETYKDALNFVYKFIREQVKKSKQAQKPMPMTVKLRGDVYRDKNDEQRYKVRPCTAPWVKSEAKVKAVKEQTEGDPMPAFDQWEQARNEEYKAAKANAASASTSSPDVSYSEEEEDYSEYEEEEPAEGNDTWGDDEEIWDDEGQAEETGETPDEEEEDEEPSF